MKILSSFIIVIFLIMSATAYGLGNTNDPGYDQKKLELASQGCQKPLGFFPTPSKLMCIFTALGKADTELKSRALALIFSTCHGHTLQPQAAGSVPKKYNTLGDCLRDPAAITLINKELTAEGFQTVKVMNPSILAPIATKK